MARHQHQDRPALRSTFRPEPLEGRRLLAGQPSLAGSLIADVNPTTDALGPDTFVSAGPVGYFVGQGFGGVGKEPWRTDGTAAGTYRLKDVRPGPAGSSPTGLAVVGDVLYFAADDGANGVELWRSDGTEAGTVLVQNIRDASKGSNPRLLTAVGDTLYFVADGTTSGNPRLWRLRDASGPAGGTAEVVPGQPADGATPAPSNLIAYNGGLLFSANNGLYRVADPAAAAARIAGGPDSFLNPRLPTLFNGQVYFVGDGTLVGGALAHGDLWRTDGTGAGTKLVKAIDIGANDYTSTSRLTVSGDRLYFLAQDYVAATPFQLWRSDGTAAGTYNLTDAKGTYNNYTPLTPVGQHSVIYPAKTAATGLEPYVTDGTVGTARLFTEFTPGPADGWNGGGFLRAGDTLYAATNRAFGDTELWASDGTPGGTALARDVEEAAGFLYPLGALNGRLVFTGGFVVGQGDLFASDGTPDGTVRVGSADAASGSSMRLDNSALSPNPAFLPVGGGVAYFSANDGVHGAELWRANPPGAEPAAELVADLNPGGFGSNPIDLTLAADGSLLFTADFTGFGNGRSLFRLAPGASTPEPVAGAGVRPYRFNAVGQAVYFVSTDTDGTRYLYRWTADAGAAKVTADGSLLADPSELAVVNGALYLSARTGSTGYEPFRADGIAAGAVLLGNLSAGTGDSSPAGFTAVGSTVYFNAVTPAAGRELWKTDGTPAGTALAAELTPGSASTAFDAMRGFGGALYFAGTAGLVRYAEAGGTYATTTVTSAPGARQFVDGPDGALYFIAGQTAATQAVYRTDGTAANTARLSGPGTAAADPTFIPTTLLAAGGRVWAAGRTGTDSTNYKVELWAADPGAAVAAKVRDLAPTVVGSIYLNGFYIYGREALSADDQFLYFPAYTPEAGVEPYRLSLARAPSLVDSPVGDGTAQRSQVRSITLRFDQKVALAADALALTRWNSGGSGANDGSAPTDVSSVLSAPTTPDGGLTWVFTFAPGAYAEAGGSLKDGIYTMTVNPAAVTTAGGATLGVAPAPLTFHRRFGDSDGNRTVNNADYVRFRNAFGSAAGQATYNSVYDFDGNGVVNNLDYVQFRNRFGTTFNY